MEILIALLIIGLVVYFGFWMVDQSGIPAPFNFIIKGVVLIVGLLWLFGGSADVPRLNI